MRDLALSKDNQLITIDLEWIPSKSVGVDFITGGIHDYAAKTSGGYRLRVKGSELTDKKKLIECIRSRIIQLSGKKPAVMPPTASGLIEFTFDSVPGLEEIHILVSIKQVIEENDLQLNEFSTIIKRFKQMHPRPQQELVQTHEQRRYNKTRVKIRWSYLIPVAIILVLIVSPILFHYFRSLSTSSSPISLIDQSWTELGPRPITLNNQPLYSGRITAIGINGSNPLNIYIGAAQGGVWKSENGGASWVQLTDIMPSLSIGAIAFSPDYRVMYVGTGEPNHHGSYSGEGIYKSTDGGKTWTILGSSVFEGSSISSVLVNAVNPNRILVATTFGSCCNGLYDNNNSPFGIYLSNDGGINWTPVLAPYGNQFGFSDLVSPGSDPNTVYASSFNGTVWLSRDGGSSWSKIFNVIDPSCSQGIRCRSELAISNAQPSLLFLAISDSLGDLYGIFKYDTTTGDIATLARPSGACGSTSETQCDYDLLIEVDPSNPSIIYFGGRDLYRSDNGGQSWVDLGGYIYDIDVPDHIHADQHALAFLPGNPSTIFVGNDGGIWKSTDRGNTWIDLNEGLGITQFYSVAGSPDSVLTGGSQDNGCVVKNSNNSFWQFSLGGDGVWVGVEASRPNILYCGEEHLNFFKSTDGGISWAQSTNGINISDQSLFRTPYAQDPNNPGTLYTAGTHVYKTTNFASSWYDVSGPLGNTISVIAVAPSDSVTVYLGDIAGNIKVSRDGGATWQIIGTSLGRVISIDIDPSDSNTVYVISGAGRDIHKFSFSSGTWHQVYLSPPPYVPNVVKLDKLGNIYVGTDRGIFFSNNQGNTWFKLGSGLPNSAVYSLSITKSNELIAGTHGRGLWIISLNSLTKGVKDKYDYAILGLVAGIIPVLIIPAHIFERGLDHSNNFHFIRD
jgi:photosystem II stability/assembly factor-like uncharacterized protein